MMRLHARVDDERTAAAPVLVLDECADTVHVVRGVAAREGDPHEVGDGRCGEARIVAQYEQRHTLQIGALQLARERGDLVRCRFVARECGTFDRGDTRHHHRVCVERPRQPHPVRHL